MTVIYLKDSAGALNDAVQLPEIPGLGIQLPSNAIELRKPLSPPNDGYAWILVDGQAELIEDQRGTVYQIATGTQQQYDQLGPLPSDLTVEPRPSEAYVWQSGAWAKSMTYATAAKITEINQRCEATIIAGFTSTALGESYVYASLPVDQLNLTSASLRGVDMPYPCLNSEGVKAYRAHTAAQLAQVWDDFERYKTELLLKADTLKKRVEQASSGSVDDVESITWEADPS
ncbi:hypothetical protein [Pseudomonas syringae]|uniref:DUF4376 domain-containing protein n=1 Tax=Pseudomonas syringae pv. actinidiae TaxID=103796 RepID=A0A7Z6U9W6_PSESF|nr:hypothetical protein [Pseudomonas syringae]RMP81226.1 hypothetical protein ALQ15_02296 [Pseudomonas syringae pv. actinidiae]